MVATGPLGDLDAVYTKTEAAFDQFREDDPLMVITSTRYRVLLLSPASSVCVAGLSTNLGVAHDDGAGVQSLLLLKHSSPYRTI